MKFNLTKREKEIDNFLKACTNLYGVLKHREFLKIINKYITPKVKKNEVMQLWYKLVDAGEKQILKRGYIVFEDLIINDLADRELIDEILHENREVCEVSYELLMQYKDPDFIEEDEYTQNLRNFVAKLENDNIADHATYNAVFGSRCEIPLPLLLERVCLFISPDNEKQLEKLFGKVVDVANNSRKWILRGYSPNDIFAKEANNVIPFRKK